MAKEKIKNFLNFLYLCWLTINLPEPTPLQYDIAKYLADKKIRAKIVQAFRGVGKTWITAAYVCWRLHINRDEKILIVSASEKKAIEISIFIKRLIAEMDILKELKPNARDNERDAVTAFDVAGCQIAVAPSVKVLGIFGQLTGCRATIIIADDVETSENSRTQEMRDKINDAVTEFDNIISPTGEIIYLGTPHTQQSLYRKLVARGYSCRIWICRYLADSDQDKYDGFLAPFVIADDGHKEGEPTEPLRFNQEILLDKEMKMGRSKFQTQFMLNPALSDMERYPLKCADLIVMNLDPERAPEKVVWTSDKTKAINDLICCGFNNDRFYSPMFVSEKWLEYQEKILTIDPSGKGKDELAFSVLGLLNSQIFWLDNGGMQGGYIESNLVFIANKAKEWKVRKVIVEANFGGGMFTALFTPILKRIYPDCGIEEVKQTKQKEVRIIDTLEPVLNQHRLIVNRKVITDDFKYSENYPSDKKTIYNVIYQLTHITKDAGCLAHDDRLDALEIGVSQLIEAMSLDVDEQIRNREEEELEELLEEYMESHGATVAKDRDLGTWMYL